MAAYNSYSKRVKNALKAVLAAITYDTGSGVEPAFVSVLDNTKGEFDGYPLVRVLPGDVTTTKGAVGENDRVISFVVRVHLMLENKPETESATYDWMYSLTDLIIDTLDVGDFTDALHAADATLTNLLKLDATRGDWMVAESNAGDVIMCDVNVGVSYYKSLS